MNLLPALTLLTLTSSAEWDKPLWDSPPLTKEEKAYKRPKWWGRQCEESHPSLVWNWLDAIRDEDGLTSEEMPELLGSTVARMLPRLAPSVTLGQVTDDKETWGGPPLLAMHGVLDLCYVEVAAIVEAVGSGSEALEEVGVEPRGRASLELRHGYDVLFRPSRLIWAKAARGLDAAAIGFGGSMGWVVGAPGHDEESRNFLVRTLPTIEVGPRFLWDVSSWMALTVDMNAVLSGPAETWRNWQDGTPAHKPGLKVLFGAIFRAPEEPLVELFKAL